MYIPPCTPNTAIYREILKYQFQVTYSTNISCNLIEYSNSTFNVLLELDRGCTPWENVLISDFCFYCEVLLLVQVQVLDFSSQMSLRFGLGTFFVPDSVHV